MDRFDKLFHDVDRVTRRPFSWGHPDGVWIIAIIYSMSVIATGGSAILTMLMAKQFLLSALVPFFVTSVLFVPPMILLFRRSKAAVNWMLVLAIGYVAAGVAIGTNLQRQGQFEATAFVGILAAVLMQGYFAYYAYNLKDDALLR